MNIGNDGTLLLCEINDNLHLNHEITKKQNKEDIEEGG